ncbi:hypothetical protein IFR05_015715 [Cadophora sp. M221]|nr:hypothetical protein IFR05_015715 [Cadophora sp. M221]
MGHEVFCRLLETVQLLCQQPMYLNLAGNIKWLRIRVPVRYSMPDMDCPGLFYLQQIRGVEHVQLVPGSQSPGLYYNTAVSKVIKRMTKKRFTVPGVPGPNSIAWEPTGLEGPEKRVPGTPWVWERQSWKRAAQNAGALAHYGGFPKTRRVKWFEYLKRRADRKWGRGPR